MTFFSNLGTNLFSIFVTFFTFFREFFVGEISLEKRKTKFRIILFASLFFSYFYFASNSSFDYNALFRSIFFNQSFPLVLSFHLKLSLITNKVHSFRMNFRFFFFEFIFDIRYVLSRIFRWRNLIGKEKNETRISPFARFPFSFERGCACLPGRHGVPPLRSWGQSISNLTFLPTNDLVHRRIYEPPLFLPSSIPLVYFRPRFRSKRFNRGIIRCEIFRKLCCRKRQ